MNRRELMQGVGSVAVLSLLPATATSAQIKRCAVPTRESFERVLPLRKCEELLADCSNRQDFLSLLHCLSTILIEREILQKWPKGNPSKQPYQTVCTRCFHFHPDNVTPSMLQHIVFECVRDIAQVVESRHGSWWSGPVTMTTNFDDGRGTFEVEVYLGK